jgi:hypothetical protein
MKKGVFVLFFISFVSLSCNSVNKYFDEFYKDYFPLKTGMRWVYRTSEGNVVTMEVVADSSVNPQVKRYVVELMGELDYFLKGADAVFLEHRYTEIVNNELVDLEEVALPILYQPVLGEENMADSVFRTFVVYGDTFNYRRNFYAEVEKLESGRISLKYKILTDIYRGEFHKITKLETFYELAADTGPVFLQKVQDGDTFKFYLINFSSN